jgi:hypothetical protein
MWLFPKPLADPRSPRRIALEWFACEKLIGDADFEAIACIPEAIESANQESHPTTCKFPEQSGRLKAGPKCFAKLSRFYHVRPFSADASHFATVLKSSVSSRKQTGGSVCESNASATSETPFSGFEDHLECSDRF